MYEKILVAVDHSEVSARALEAARGLDRPSVPGVPGCAPRGQPTAGHAPMAGGRPLSAALIPNR